MTERVEVKELIRQDGPESADTAYLAWKRKKIEAALEQADAHPDDVTPLNEILKKYVLED
jgi:hypothetical protein